MVDPVTPPEQLPITVDPATSVAMILVAFRQLALILAGGATLLGFLKARDIAGLVSYLQGDSFALLVTTAVALATLLYGQYRAFVQKRDSVTMAHASPNTVAVVRYGWLSRLLLASKIGTLASPTDGK